ncbi:MAG TPA: glycosyl hydrolase family 28 protein [Catalimonadaceae bacterium]|nr:glycosyl hydrolase family 28 protein [Catalimonadaceae bacterium]
MTDFRSMPRIFILLFIATIFTLDSRGETILITSQGAVGDGIFLNTQIINQCITKVAEKGGGYVVIPAGIFRSGTIELKSNVILRLESGSVLKAVFLTDGIKDVKTSQVTLLKAVSASRTGIIGEGTIEGIGPEFSPLVPGTEILHPVKSPTAESSLLDFRKCDMVEIRGIHVKNGSGSSLSFFRCRNTTVDGIRISGSLLNFEADGISIQGGQSFRIQNTRIETGGNGISFSTTSDSDSCIGVMVSNCFLQATGTAFLIGKASANDFRQFLFSNSIIQGSGNAIGLLSENGGNISDVMISNILADNNAPVILTEPIHLHLLKPESGQAGTIRNVSIQDFSCSTQGRILLVAQKGTVVENIQLRNIRLRYPWLEDPSPFTDKTRHHLFIKLPVATRKQRASIVAEQIKNLVVNHIQVEWPSNEVPSDWKWPQRMDYGMLGENIHPNYNRNKECDLDILWGNQLEGGYIWAPNSVSSSGKPGMLLTGCRNFTVR